MSLQLNSTLGKDSRGTSSLDEFKLQVRGVKPRSVASWVNVNGVPVLIWKSPGFRLSLSKKPRILYSRVFAI